MNEDWLGDGAFGDGLYSVDGETGSFTPKPSELRIVELENEVADLKRQLALAIAKAEGR